MQTQINITDLVEAVPFKRIEESEGDLELTWDLVNITATEMKIQLAIEDPVQVS